MNLSAIKIPLGIILIFGLMWGCGASLPPRLSPPGGDSQKAVDQELDYRIIKRVMNQIAEKLPRGRLGLVLFSEDVSENIFVDLIYRMLIEQGRFVVKVRSDEIAGAKNVTDYFIFIFFGPAGIRGIHPMTKMIYYERDIKICIVNALDDKVLWDDDYKVTETRESDLDKVGSAFGL